MDQEENILGKEKIRKLILKFSIPSIISLLVNSLYNIVDQIFIGRGVGYLGNGATNVVFPLVAISLAFSLMIGDGTSALLSLKLGEKKNIFTTIINNIWLYRCFKRICIKLWIHNSNRITFYDDWNIIKFYNKSRWYT